MKIRHLVNSVCAIVICSFSSFVLSSEGFHECDDSPVKAFQNIDVNSAIEIDIKADFNKINGSPNRLEAQSLGVVTLNGRSINVKIEARGNSRFTYCGFRPLTLRFLGELDGTALEGVGKKLKVVTHCGKKEGDQWILGGTPEEQRERLLSEYYTYTILQEFDTTILDARLANISYYDMEGNKIEQALGFLREPVKKMAKRCGLKKAKDDDILAPNQDSIFEASLISKFVTSNDWGYREQNGLWAGHNIAILKSIDGNAYLAPYDFDLTAVIRPNYWKNRELSLEEHSMSFAAWLDMVTEKPQKQTALIKIKKKLGDIRGVVDGSILSNQSKERFNRWLELYGNVIDYALYGEN